MIRVAWSSIAQSQSSTPVRPARDLEHLYHEWQAASHKGDFMARLDLATAQCLASVICDRNPPRYPKAKQRRSSV